MAGAATVPGFDYCGMASRGHCKTVVRNIWGWEFAWQVLCDWGLGAGGVVDAEIGHCFTGTCGTRQAVSQGPFQFSAYIPLVLGVLSAVPLHILKLHQLYSVTTFYRITIF